MTSIGAGQDNNTYRYNDSCDNDQEIEIVFINHGEGILSTIYFLILQIRDTRTSCKDKGVLSGQKYRGM